MINFLNDGSDDNLTTMHAGQINKRLVSSQMND